MLKSIKDNLRNLFPASGTNTVKRPAIDPDPQPDATGPLNRSAEFNKEFKKWKTSAEADTLLKNLYTNYLNGEPATTAHMGIKLHISPGADGFSIYDLKENSIDTYRFLMDHLKEKTIGLAYQPYSSTWEQKTRMGQTIALERHYLKPAVRSTETPMDQLFGNILIELEMTGAKAKNLKLLATHYTGYDYKPAGSFDELIRNLLQ
jgi:hypothetical protein